MCGVSQSLIKFQEFRIWVLKTDITINLKNQNKEIIIGFKMQKKGKTINKLQELGRNVLNTIE